MFRTKLWVLNLKVKYLAFNQKKKGQYLQGLPNEVECMVCLTTMRMALQIALFNGLV
jgi:hypothetical protein